MGTNEPINFSKYSSFACELSVKSVDENFTRQNLNIFHIIQNRYVVGIYRSMGDRMFLSILPQIEFCRFSRRWAIHTILTSARTIWTNVYTQQISVYRFETLDKSIELYLKPESYNSLSIAFLCILFFVINKTTWIFRDSFNNISTVFKRVT